MNGYDYSRTSFGYTGFNIFGRVYPIKYVLLQAQPELNYNWGSEKYYDGRAKYKYPGQFTPSLLLGSGAAIPMGTRNGALLLMIQYDVLQETRSPYGNKPFFTMDTIFNTIFHSPHRSLGEIESHSGFLINRCRLCWREM